MNRPDWKPRHWWRVIAPDGTLWCDASDEGEVRASLRPGDILQSLWYREEFQWRDEWFIWRPSFAEFDQFCLDHAVADDEAPQAFAAWLSNRSGMEISSPSAVVERDMRSHE